ncbi:ssd1p-like RN [Cryptosporidium sp. chipmunk genotype I]|uniref:ssd1p-like RN n=1 Tax=Cryptosporidium sp. chipmunk genotype I TaxID=1280935 RepID=UPI00351A6894|nr:ssd1p-like RN [Cryptosporidium sp. chipmunk genotype I]
MARQDNSLGKFSQNKVKSTSYKGVIRVANPLERFVTVDDQVNGPFDIYIFGQKNIKGAIHGDTVLVRVFKIFQGRLTKRFREKISKKSQQGKQDQKCPTNTYNSTEVNGQLKYASVLEDPNSEDISDTESNYKHEYNSIFENCQDEDHQDTLASFQKDESIPTDPNQGSNKENFNTGNYSETLAECSSHSKHPIPKYVGTIIKVVESVTKKNPIVGFIRPISYLERFEKEAEMRKRSKKFGKKPSFKSIEELSIKNCLKGIGIDDNDAKLRTLVSSDSACIRTNKLCFVPIQRVYPIMRLFLDNNTKKDFVKNNVIQDNKIPSNSLFGALINVDHKSGKRKLQITKFYGSCNKFETIFSSLLDCFNLGSHKEIYNKYQNTQINVSKSSKEWMKQSNRREFSPKEYQVFTIDPPTARDLDDAIHIKYDNELKIYEVGVHIADVYYYMLRHRELLTATTKKLCTSVYLPHTNFPMLPRVFSSNLCSLLPNQRRPTLSVIIKVNQEGEVIGEPEFVHGIITSTGKFSYDDVDKLFEIVDQIDKRVGKSKVDKFLNYCQDSRIVEIMKKSTVYRNNRSNTVRDLLLLRTLTSIIRNSKARSGSIKLFNVDPFFNFNSEFYDNITKPFDLVKSNGPFDSMKDNALIPNLELKFDIQSLKPNSLKEIFLKRVTLCYNHSISHSLIEELMLLANRVTAEFTVKNRPELSCIIRIHDEIAYTKLYQLITYLRKHGFNHIFEDNINRENIVNGLHKLYRDYGILYYCTVSEMLREIFSRAKYIFYNENARDSNISTNHYALNMKIYTHFTSPIRRAADVLVHQMLYDILDNISNSKMKSKDNSKNKYNKLIFSKNDQAIICENSNIKSNASKNMQRDSNNIFFSQLITKIDFTIPSIACIHKMNASKLKVHLVLLYPTDFHQLFLISTNSFINNSSLLSLLKLQPSLPIDIKSIGNKIKLHWKYNENRIKAKSKNLNTPTRMGLLSYLDMINNIMSNKFQHKITFDQTNKLIVQTIGIWSYLPVYLIPTTTLPPKFVVVPMSPLSDHFYEQISNFN